MANPNIVNVTSIIGNSLTVAVGTSATQLASNAASSGKVFKINSILIANIDGTAAYDATVELRLADGTTYRALGSTISVPADATLILLDKTTTLYLLDTSVTGQPSTLWATSSTASKLTFTVSYEAIT